MKRYHYSDILYSHIPIHPKLENTIYLVPPQSVRYLFKYKDSFPYIYTIKCNKKFNSLVIHNESEMIDFFKFYTVKNVVNWNWIKVLFDGIEFQWYKPYWNCSPELQQHIQEKDAWEWYSNIEEPSGFVWQCFTMSYRLKQPKVEKNFFDGKEHY